MSDYYLKWACYGNVGSCPFSSAAWTQEFFGQTLNTCNPWYGQISTCSAKEGVVQYTYSDKATCTGNVTNTYTIVAADGLAAGGVYDSANNYTMYVFVVN